MVVQTVDGVKDLTCPCKWAVRIVLLPGGKLRIDCALPYRKWRTLELAEAAVLCRPTAPLRHRTGNSTPQNNAGNLQNETANSTRHGPAIASL